VQRKKIDDGGINKSLNQVGFIKIYVASLYLMIHREINRWGETRG
jgi:hypothetical protein